jgi:hypothetical protein
MHSNGHTKQHIDHALSSGVPVRSSLLRSLPPCWCACCSTCSTDPADDERNPPIHSGLHLAGQSLLSISTGLLAGRTAQHIPLQDAGVHTNRSA